MRWTAIIPARGGSKGIPRKNVRLVGGRPLLAHTIEHARSTPDVARVVVSTDDDEIAGVARAAGADVVARPAALAGDTASSESALLHALDVLQAESGQDPPLVAFLQPTSPVRQPGALAAAIETFDREGADSLFSAVPVHGFVWRLGATGPQALSYDPTARPRRQDAPVEVVENGSIYLFRSWVLREFRNRLGGRIAVSLMDPLDGFQVDEPSDLALADRLIGLIPRSASDRAATRAGLARVRLLALDFDGVLTDDRVLVTEGGREAVYCHRGDGWGIARLRDAGVDVVVISTEANPVVAARCRKLGVECVHGCDDKLPVLRGIAEARGLEAATVAYVGNDVNDLACLRWAGHPVAVADAAAPVRAAARHVTTRPGGRGAVREVAEWLLEARGRDASASPDPGPHRLSEERDDGEQRTDW